MHVWCFGLLYLLRCYPNKVTLLTRSHMQVHENIFTESNKLIKSIQIFLNALNELRLCHVMERSSLPLKRESSKVSLVTYPFSWSCLMLLEFLVFLRF